MDLNTVLMESITTMSECFVAANTRTSFTDIAESGPLSSSNHVGGTTQTSQQNSTTTQVSSGHHLGLGANISASNNNHNTNNQNQLSQSPTTFPETSLHGIHKLGLHNYHTQTQQHLNSTIRLNSSQHNHHLQHHQQPQQPQQQHSQCNNLSNTHYQNQNSNANQHHISNGLYSASTNNSSNNLQSNSGTSSSRLSQPIRTQIPIHCYIEQLDACADLHSYNSPLTDSDLFNTTNNNFNNNSKLVAQSPQSNHHHHQNHSNNNNHHHHPHLSKLALESVTNGIVGSSGSAAASSNSLPSSMTNTPNNPFNENDTNNPGSNNKDPKNLDTNDSQHDQPSSNSPLSMHLQTASSSMTTSSGTNIQLDGNCVGSIAGRPSSTTYDHNHFQSCRETYAIVTSNVLYIDLVRTVLLQLGYSAMDLINAKATIQIKNWRPLALDQVTEDKRATVGEVLGDISTFVTLRIRLYSSVTQLPTEWTETMIRQVVLALTQTMSQLTLSKLCNISQPLISSIVRGGKKLGRRKCAEFGQWYLNYIKSADARPSTMFCEGSGARLVFDKSREIPQLKAWFANNTKPSDELLEEYSKILNEHALRKDRPQVSAKALRNWWKNERQKLGIRQREIRGRPKLKRID